MVRLLPLQEQILIENLLWVLSTLPQGGVYLSGREDEHLVFPFRKTAQCTDKLALATRFRVQLLKREATSPTSVSQSTRRVVATLLHRTKGIWGSMASL